MLKAQHHHLYKNAAEKEPIVYVLPFTFNYIRRWLDSDVYVADSWSEVCPYLSSLSQSKWASDDSSQITPNQI